LRIARNVPDYTCAGLVGAQNRERESEAEEAASPRENKLSG
jgi:hypothetical protein